MMSILFLGFVAQWYRQIISQCLSPCPIYNTHLLNYPFIRLEIIKETKVSTTSDECDLYGYFFQVPFVMQIFTCINKPIPCEKKKRINENIPIYFMN